MASTNQSPFYRQAEGKFLSAKTNEEKLVFLEEMIRECPKHKSSEKMLANLKTRYIKLKEKIEVQKKTSKGSKKTGIKKEEMQAVLIGKTNSGKSSLISLLTNTTPEIASYKFTTKSSVVGMMPYSGTQIQLVEIPAIDSEYYDKGVVHTADTLLIVINSLEELGEVNEKIGKTSGKKIIIFNIKNPLDKRKLEATMKSKKLNFVIINTKTGELGNIKDKLFQSFDKIRVFTKEPGRAKSEKPIIMKPDSTIYEVAEKIFHGFSKQVTESRVTGPSSKFPNQKVGLKHKLKDMDVVEFKTR